MYASARPQPRRRWLVMRLFLGLIFILLIFGIVSYLWPVAPIKPTALAINSNNSPARLAWPADPECSIGTTESGLLASHGNQNGLPTASVAKLVTALTVLAKYPLEPGQQGASIVISPADVAIYQKYVAENGSVVQVATGESLSEYQALEAMMLPSANNIADTLAIWAYGSMASYRQAATSFLNTNGLAHTVIGADASGFLPSTVSTSNDLVQLGILTLNNPVLAKVVSLKQAVLPVAGIVRNVNWLLGSDGIIGIKTGNTNQAGGVYVFASQQTIDGQPVTIVGSILGSVNLYSAMSGAPTLINSVVSNFVNKTLIKKGQLIANYKLPWGGNVGAKADKAINGVYWAASTPTPKWSLAYIKPGSSSVSAGTVEFDGAKTTVSLVKPLPQAPFWWKMLRFL